MTGKIEELTDVRYVDEGVSKVGKLLDKVTELSPFIKIQPCETFIGIYKGWKEVNSQFGPAFEYSFDVDGQPKTWTQKSLAVARLLDEVALGTKIKIVRSEKDDAGKTKYTVTTV